MPSPEEPTPFFDDPAQLQIASDFASKCILCKVYLKPGEGHYILLLNTHKMYLKCLKGLYTKLSVPWDACNGLYACQPCAHKWLLETDDKRALAALIPCEPLMVYALHALSLAVDEASRAQTLDALLCDLASNRNGSKERRLAAPFLNCYQLCPVEKPSTSNLNRHILSVHPSPLTYVKVGASDEDARPAQTYCIIEHDLNTVREPAAVAPRRVPLYRQCKDDDAVLTLFRLPMRDPGLFFGYADAAVVSKSSDPALFKAFIELHFKMRYGRGLPVGYRMQGVPSDDEAFVWVKSRSRDTWLPAPSNSSGAPDHGPPIHHVSLEHRESSSESDNSSDNKKPPGLGFL